MDIYKALADFSPQEKQDHTFSFKQGDRFEILEFECDRAEKAWWAAKNVKDGEIGYIPGKFFILDSIKKGPLSDDSKKERDMQVEQLETMQRQQEEPLPDLYKLPPLEIQPYDQEYRDDSNAESEEDPSPDYSDAEDDNDENDNIDKSQIKAKLVNKLSLEDWERIKQKAGEADTPDPDYEDPQNGSANGYAHQGSSTEGTIAPKKLHNPVIESKMHQNLHRELMMSQKRGESVLNKKSELQKELERRRTVVKKKEYADYLESKKPEIEKKMDEQAEKMKKFEIKDVQVKESKPDNQSEFQRVHSKIKKNTSS